MKRGFSLSEVLVSLAVASLIIYAASASFVNLSPKYRLKKAAWEVCTRLNYARYKAIFEGRPRRVRFQSAGYAIEKYDEAAKQWQPDVSGVLEGVRVEANNSPIFHPLGTVSNLATIILSNSWGKYRITLAISGRIRAVMI